MAGRKPGSLVRAKCCICGTVERTTGTGGFYRCTACRAAGHWHESRREEWLGTRAAQSLVARAVREGRLPHPRGMACTDCGGAAIEYEHRDYNQPLAVEPICRRCNLRRGPARPLRGTLHAVVVRGFAPYRLRTSAERLFALMGLNADSLAQLPTHLNADHWRELLPHIPEHA